MAETAHGVQAEPSEQGSSAKCPTSPRLALPAPPPPITSGERGPDETGEEAATQINVNGASVSLFDKMGPTIVNSDGTLSRIVGWPEMTPDERKRTLRVLGKRNQIRLEAKKEELGIKNHEDQTERLDNHEK